VTPAASFTSLTSASGSEERAKRRSDVRPALIEHSGVPARGRGTAIRDPALPFRMLVSNSTSPAPAAIASTGHRASVATLGIPRSKRVP
jgi:hypothetical protein